ncbi:Hsp20/alpha crystallin family protein [Allostreptomyces psammosilenae]|uniref:HSP20 family protein n=1 Tax=Allostreptomyces psammosilenae TaxID=1892865 RepID=A0A853AB42_9ACTN|nr:Hsp20/alpha crystallin family protein [Allostreptomyces psammosilenae]NYI07831.1 HSP20 family protein [Allostreptomyces psammosilenae]
MTLPARRGGGLPARGRGPWGLWDPFSELENLWGEMGRLFERGAVPAGERPWMPLAEEVETESEYLVRAELPGVPRENVDVEVDDNELRIHGKLEEEQRGRVLSRRTGEFAYRTTLPGGIDSDHVEADLSEGILTVHIPKAAPAKRHRIEIGGGGKKE